MPKNKSTNWAQVQTPSEWMKNNQPTVTKVVEINYNQPADRHKQNFGTRPTYQQHSKLVDSSTNTDFVPQSSNEETRRSLKKVSLFIKPLIFFIL